MEKTNGVASMLGLAAQTGLGGLPNVGKITTGTSDISFSDALLKTSDVKTSVSTSPDLAKKTVTTTNVKNTNDVVKSQKDTSLNKDGMKQLSDEVSKKAEELMDKIKSEFSKTDEEIEEAMEVLALSVQDLFNPADLRSLMMELTETSDSIELITNVDLYESIKSVETFADELISQLSTEFEVSKDELTEIMDSEEFKNIMSSLVTEDEANIQIDTEKTDDTIKVADTEANAKTSETIAENASKEKKPVEVTVKIEDNAESNNASRILTNETNQNNATANGGKKQNLFSKNDNNESVATTQTVTTQTVNTVGDIVETVTSYSSYADTENIMRQVTDFVKVNISGDVTKMEMQLHPASLGTVNMQLNSQNGQITAHLTVQNELVKSILETQMVKLQETFNEQGTKVTAIEVTVASYNLDAKSDNNYSQSGNEGSRKGSRRGINLNELDSFDELTDEEQLQAEVMEMNGGSVNYTA